MRGALPSQAATHSNWSHFHLEQHLEAACDCTAGMALPRAHGGVVACDWAPRRVRVAAGYGPASVLENSEALEEGKRTDLQAAALLVAELWAAGLADGPAGLLPRATLRRLLFDVFHEDVAQFRHYCLEVRRRRAALGTGGGAVACRCGGRGPLTLMFGARLPAGRLGEL